MKCKLCGYVYKQIKPIYVVQKRAPIYHTEIKHCPNCGHIN